MYNFVEKRENALTKYFLELKIIKALRNSFTQYARIVLLHFYGDASQVWHCVGMCICRHDGVLYLNDSE
jgi:hypothetical protein